MDTELFTKLAQGGFAAGLLFLLYLVGMRLVKALDKLAMRVDEHTKVDLEHHAEVKEAIIAMHATFSAVHDLTPVEGTPKVKRKTAPRGYPVGEYGPMRPKTRSEDD